VTRVLPRLVGAFLIVLFAGKTTSATDPQDGINLAVSPGTSPGALSLAWTPGPGGPYVVYRSTGGPPDASASNALGTTGALSWTDAPLIARALQRYGMILADGGNIALTAASDRFTAAKWTAVLPSGSTGLAAIRVTDFEMIDGGTRIPLTYECVRNP